MSYSDLVLFVARKCEVKSKCGGARAGEYHRLAQHLKKSAGHLRFLESEEKGGRSDGV